MSPMQNILLCPQMVPMNLGIPETLPTHLWAWLPPNLCSLMALKSKKTHLSFGF